MFDKAACTRYVDTLLTHTASQLLATASSRQIELLVRSTLAIGKFHLKRCETDEDGAADRAIDWLSKGWELLERQEAATSKPVNAKLSVRATEAELIS